MKVLVLGGTGAIGIHLVRLLSENGIETFVTSRNPKESKNSIKYIQGNAYDIFFLKTILEEHWDAIVDFMIYTTQNFKERVSLFLNATNQYVFLSSARVYANVEPIITENSPRLLDVSDDKEYLKTDEYALAKARQEDILKKSGHKNWTIIRPYITYSENRLQLGILEKEIWLYRVLQGKTIVFSEDIYQKKTTLTYGLDVSKGIASIIGNSKALGEIFQITQNKEESRTWGEIFEKIYVPVMEKYLGHKPKILLLDKEQFLKIPFGKYQIIYDRLFDRSFDNSKIEKYFGTKDFTKHETGLQNCLEKFLRNPQFKNINWHIMSKMDRYTGEISFLTELKSFMQRIKSLHHKIKNKILQ
ncbi:MAG: NAD-dependent epimerase/dehydratase family protein [Bacteroidales bacterium]|jgi:nucleoside-diphosphate-sugar epimerase|nr:NAD-dependent epimerase/dehydratase family protein [Bacteroidales bacterium]